MIHPVKRLELLFWTVLPGLITVGLMIFVLVSKHITHLSSFMPALPLIPVYYWGMAHAREMPYWFVFLVGLILDAVTGLPLGLTSLLYIFFLALLHVQRKYIHKEGFIIKWGYFAILMAVTSSLNWILLTFFYSQAQHFLPPFIQWFLTVCVYPVFHKAFDILNDHVHARRWQLLHG